MELGVTGTMTTMLHLAVAGDEAAFARIVAAYHADLVRVAYGICCDADLALDAVQATWLIAWRKLATVREPDHLRSWLVAVAANEARHLIRHRRPVVEIPVGVEGDAPDPSDEPSRLDLVNALRRLRPDERALIAMRYGAELDSAEIAPLLGISASGVRSRLLRLLGRLRRELDDVRA
jgi:RNA polymerase sigma-70 factor (ECF subfamily)